MNGARFAVFLTLVLVIWTFLHAYVFWRTASVPWIAAHCSRRTIWILAALLWSTYPLARFAGAQHWHAAVPLEWAGATWIGVLFLLFAMLLFVDAGTLGGRFGAEAVPQWRGYAVVTSLVLSIVALIQGLRPPVTTHYEVRLRGLPKERDGLVLAVISDAHLGTLIGEQWLNRLVDDVNAARPDMIAVAGDLVDGNVDHVESLLPVLKRFQAPSGKWAVTGNHEFYAGRERSIRLMEQAGFTVLQDGWKEAVPGLVVAGVDDLGARSEFGFKTHPLEKALEGRPPGAVVWLSHTPWKSKEAAAAGVGLMLSGHTHDGQIWPFGWMVRLSYALTSGRYEIGGMTAIVCRGTGTWGPRMRLWRPSEWLLIRLRTETS